jgi:acrylyl-CoA reductase (NADPH)
MPRALLLYRDEPRCRIERLADDELPDLDVRVDVAWSDLNYKDALAVTGRGPIVRRYPLVPGVDLVGTVCASADARYDDGDQVLAGGWGMGEKHWGGFAESMRLDPDWLVPLPPALSCRDAALLGAAGFTAMLCALRLEGAGVRPDSGPVVVTGATGGVGSWAVQILAQRGFEVHAVTGKADSHDWLRTLGATSIHDRADFESEGRTLEPGRWAGGVDNVGGHVLARILAQTAADGSITAVGLAGSADLPTTVMPFILRGVALLGMNSVDVPYGRRIDAWKHLAALPREMFDRMEVEEIGLEQIEARSDKMLRGQITGRVLIDPNR